MSNKCSGDEHFVGGGGCLSRPSWGTVTSRGQTTIARVIPEVEFETETRLDEEGTILAWRVWVLDRAGYGIEGATALAASKDVDLHVAVDLLERGCPAETALRILL